MAEELTSQQRARLRSRARRMAAQLNIGKAGLSPSLVEHLGRLLGRQELVKVRLLESVADDRRELAQKLAQAVQAEVIDLVGRVIVLYRPKPADAEGS